MKRKLSIAILVALVVALAATSVSAAGAGKSQQQRQQKGALGVPQVLPGRQWFALVGVITDLTPESLTVQVYRGNRLVKPYLGEELTVVLTEATRYCQWTPDGCVPVTFDEVVVGDTTNIVGLVLDGLFSARRVVVDVPCCSP